MARFPLSRFLFLPLSVLEAVALAYVLRSVARYLGLSNLLPNWIGESIHQTVLIVAYTGALTLSLPHPTRRTAALAAAPLVLVVAYDVYMTFTSNWAWAVSAMSAAVFGLGLYAWLAENARLNTESHSPRWHRPTTRRRQ